MLAFVARSYGWFRQIGRRALRTLFWIAAFSIGVVLVRPCFLHIDAVPLPLWLWRYYKSHHDDINPLLTPAAALAAASVALGQLRIARLRHQEQTKADRQRRITESFSKAAEQLANKEVEVRLGGIYTLERISRESPDDYWTIVETLTAFVRERARWTSPSESDAGAAGRENTKIPEGRQTSQPC
jgi:hypothetical protein